MGKKKTNTRGVKKVEKQRRNAYHLLYFSPLQAITNIIDFLCWQLLLFQ